MVRDSARRNNFENKRKTVMNKLALKLYLTYQLLKEEHGQDLIEYILIGGVVGFACIAGMQSMADNFNTAFTTIGTKANSYT
jgi:Flp pilus assembly pilin Flp